MVAVAMVMREAEHRSHESFQAYPKGWIVRKGLGAGAVVYVR